MSRLHARISDEIEELHSFLGNWLNGRAENSDEVFNKGIRDRLGEQFFNIQPAGILLAREELLAQIHGGYAASPGFKIKIRSIKMLQNFDRGQFIIAMYEEYQKNARNSPKRDNARLSTVVFENRATAPLTWLHIHETWLPAINHTSSMFEF